MNHDETNLPPRPDMQPWIEPELEARVIAWVMGEASPFEIAQLEALLVEKPELAIFKRRMEAVHGLLGEAARPDRARLQLSAERRTKLFQAIGAAETAVPAGQADAAAQPSAPVAFPVSRARRGGARMLPWVWTAAACATIGVFVATQMDFTLRFAPLPPSPSYTTNGAALQVAENESGKDERREAEPMALRADSFAGAAVPAPMVTAPAPAWAPSQKVRDGGGGRVGGAAGEASFETASLAGDKTEIKNVGRQRMALGDVQLGAAPEGVAERAGGSAPNTPSFSAGALDRQNTSSPSLLNQARTEQLATFAPPPPGAAPAAGAAARGSLGTDPYAGSGAAAGARLKAGLADLAGNVTVMTEEKVSDLAVDALGKKADRAAEVSRLERDEAAPRPAELAPAIAEASTTTEPVSTFSLRVGDVSFRLARAALARGELPEPSGIRPEEFYNAFNYGDPEPAIAQKVGARLEQSSHPVLQQRNLLRIALKVPATGRAASQPLRLTVLLDTSGSMERPDRAAVVRRALVELVALLGPEDRVTLVGFARQPRLLAENVRGNQAGMLVELVARTPREGGTNLEEALKLAGDLARRHREPSAQNRIVLLTDGAANLGNAVPAQLAAAIETLRQQGIAFDACGIGLEGLDDGMLETLTRRGNGRYYALDSAEAADAGFARQLAGAFRPAAENVKVQVRFNPARVGRYRLIGFDRHRLREQDFRNDAVDAAELAAEEAASALYEIEPLPQGSGEVGELFVRFRDAATGQMVERSWTIAHEPQARPFDRAAPSLQLAGTSALLAEKLRQSPVAGQFKLADLAATVNALRGHYAAEPRVQELVAMFSQARRLTRE